LLAIFLSLFIIKFYDNLRLAFIFGQFEVGIAVAN